MTRQNISVQTNACTWSGEQRAWIQALINPNGDLPWSAWQAGVRNAPSAGAIYINNVRANVIAALSQSYPATRMCLGSQRFGCLVVEGLGRAPPASGDLTGYGGWLPQMLSEAQKQDTDALVWLARLEWHLNQASSMEDAPAWTWSDAANDMQDPEWMSASTRLRQPAQIWPLNNERVALLARVAPSMNAEWLQEGALDMQAPALIQQAARLRLVQAPELTWFNALESGDSIESATQKVLAAHPHWQPDAAFHLCLSHGLLCPLRPSSCEH